MGSSAFLKRTEYRIGFRLEETGINISGVDVTESGMSFGLSMPVNHKLSLSQSKFNIGAEYGTFGTVENGLVREEFVRVMLGFSFTPHFRNRWFVKPKYD
jgi:hypothetical protein